MIIKFQICNGQFWNSTSSDRILVCPSEALIKRFASKRYW